MPRPPCKTCVIAMFQSRQSRFCAVSSILLLIGAAVAVRRASAQEELDSLKVCANTQKLLIENAFVRVIDDRIPAGVAEAKHRHAHGLTIVLGDYEAEQTIYPEGRVVRSHRHFGDVAWTEPTVHEVRNVGKTDSHVIRVELK